ncbi:hypothetical protein RGQ15_18740 [Paracoccus sp. MBLB3053]|uniref:Uncharacterized protein n=1 Tax=Paracoccus aurantius TaxID=3073814 RepID=A0ABU2HY03_9RHOB|nr:hypothetical protein [Paracoccus sp. MBLB3053]MDS9469607.1 hypothetical protein [Paracoccus sp. MBLB3053]
MQLDGEARAEILTTISSAAASLSELDAALHAPDLADLQGKVAAVMATEIVLLRQLAAEFLGIDLPHDPAQITEVLATLSAEA